MVKNYHSRRDFSSAQQIMQQRIERTHEIMMMLIILEEWSQEMEQVQQAVRRHDEPG
jgi:hypothetical protein